MANLANLQTAPPFTAENASEMGKRSAEARARQKQYRINAEQAINGKPKIEPEINKIVRAMSKLSVMSEEHDRLAKKLKDLWSLAFPTQAAVKSRSTSRPAGIPDVKPEAPTTTSDPV